MAPFWAIFVGYSTSFLADFVHLGQFSKTVKPDGFHETHALGVSKSPEALQAELRNSSDGSILGHFRRL